jgi:hypothetical protein
MTTKLIEQYTYTDFDGVEVEIARSVDGEDRIAVSAWLVGEEEGPICYVPREEVEKIVAWLITWLDA